jgi:predicted transcriptional regulator
MLAQKQQPYYITICNSIITKMNNILVFLLNNKQHEYTIRQLSKNVDINYRIAHEQVKRLEKKGLIQTKRAGNALLCSLTNAFDEEIFQAEFTRSQHISKQLKQVQKRFQQAKQDYTLLLFGSHANNTQTAQSDIDLLAITNNSQELEDIRKDIPLDIHLTILTYNEFLQTRHAKTPNVVEQAISNNIILIGIENYYRLIHQ